MSADSINNNYFFIIDGTAVMYRSFYAIRQLTNSQGQPTNALFGFVKALEKYQKQFQPTRMVVVFDAPGDTFRDQLYEAYKEHREPMPEDLVNQIDLIDRYLKAMNLSVLSVAGVEADDVMASLAIMGAVQYHCQSIVVTADKDLMQIVDESIWMLNPATDQFIKPDDVKAKYGVPPHMIRDLLALMGDAADNVPGIPGVGPKTAAKLLNQYGSINNILDHINEMKSEKQKQVFMANKETLFLSQELVTLKKNLQIVEDWDQFIIKEPNRDQLLGFFKEVEFVSHIQKWQAKLTAIQKTKIWPEVISVDEFFFKHLPGQSSILLYGDQKLTNQIWLKILEEEKVWQIDLEDQKIKDLWLKILNQDHFWIMFNSKNIFKKLKNPIPNHIFDCEIASLMLLPTEREQDFNYMITHFLSESIVLDSPSEKICLLEKLFFFLKESLIQEGLLEFFNKIEIPLIPVLKKMEDRGIAIDIQKLKNLSKEVNLEINQLTTQIYQLAQCEFNINSPKELATVLFDQIGLPVQKKTKTGYSTDSKVLSILSKVHPLPKLILEYRQFEKMRSTYIDALEPLILNDKIHTTFRQMGASTGRLSSIQPNMQNIPIRFEWGRKIRNFFVPSSSNMMFLSADYSQIELRILAHMANDLTMIQSFKNNEDIHSMTAMEIFNIQDIHQVQPHQRRKAKAVNFGIAYGQSIFGLAQTLDIAHEDAKEIIERYFDRFPKIKLFLENTIMQAREKGYTQTLFGRKRFIPELKSKQRSLQQYGERMAINAPIQGTAADIIKIAMIELDQILQKQYRSQMLLQIHDELLFEVYSDELILIQEEVKRVMENVLILKSKLLVNLSIGSDWGQIK